MLFKLAHILLLLPVHTCLNLQHSLSPCSSFLDCSSGGFTSYNFLTEIPSISSCHDRCLSDPQCNFYSYNYSQHSPHYRHCFLTTACQGGRNGQARMSEWVSGPRVCQAREGQHSEIFLRTTK